MNVFRFDWNGNMQKKALEINPRQPLIKELLRRVEDNPINAAIMMF